MFWGAAWCLGLWHGVLEHVSAALFNMCGARISNATQVCDLEAVAVVLGVRVTLPHTNSQDGSIARDQHQRRGRVTWTPCSAAADSAKRNSRLAPLQLDHGIAGWYILHLSSKFVGGVWLVNERPEGRHCRLHFAAFVHRLQGKAGIARSFLRLFPR